MKQWSTRLPKSCAAGRGTVSNEPGRVGGEHQEGKQGRAEEGREGICFLGWSIGRVGTDSDKLLDLALLHALLELALLGRVEAA